jgi:hypothetical protein
VNTHPNQTRPIPDWCQLLTNLTELALTQAAGLTIAATVPIVFRAASDRPALWGLPPLWVLWTIGPAVVTALVLLREWLRTFDPDPLPPGRLRRTWRVLQRTRPVDTPTVPKSFPRRPATKALTHTVTGNVVYHPSVTP